MLFSIDRFPEAPDDGVRGGLALGISVAVQRFFEKSGYRSLRLITLILVPAIYWLGLFGLLGGWRLGQVEQSHVLMSPSQALLLLACAVLLTLSRLYSRRKMALCLSVMVLALYGLLASYLWEPWRAQRFGLTEMALVMAFVCGLIMGIARQAGGSLALRSGRSSLVTTIVGTFFSVAAAYVLIERDISQAQALAQTRAEVLRDNVSTAMRSSMSALERLSARWATINSHMPEEFARQEFEGLVKGFGEFKRLTYLDSNLRPLRDSVHSEAHANLLEAALKLPEFKEYLDHIVESREVHLAPPGRFVRDPAVSFVVAGVFSGAAEQRWVVATVDLQQMASSRLPDADLDCCFQIISDGQVLHGSPSPAGSRVLAVGSSATRLHHDVDLDLQFWLNESAEETGHPLLPEGILLFGLAFTFLANSSQRLTHVVRRRAQQLQRTALHDSLTGLPNRRMLAMQIQQASEQSVKDGSSISVIFFEIDGLRLISDSLGHEVADVLLVQAANCLRRELAQTATLSRLDAGDFVVCVTGLTQQEVEQLAQRLIDVVEEPLQIGSNLLRVKAYAGITRSSGLQPDPMHLVRQADLAMLKARRQGRGAWGHYTPELGEQVHARLTMYNDLQQAIESDSIELRYQPIIDGRDGNVVSFEVLMRLPHPVFGEISPTRFIPVAEESGQIIALTDWLLVRACSDAKRLEAAGVGAIPIAINISPRYFQCPDFVQRVHNALLQADLTPDRLELEITESVLLDDASLAVSKLKQLRAIGVLACLDDFGTGYSSLAYLRELPISVIKIDRTFVRNVISEPSDAAIVRGVTAMAQHMHLQVVVEGVETVAQFNFLKRSGCNLFQGYLFDRPKPLEDVIEKLRQIGRKRILPVVEPVRGGGVRLESGYVVRTVLLVGDGAWSARLATALMAANYEVRTASGAMEALDLLAQFNLDLMIIEAQLSDMGAATLSSKVADMYPRTLRWVCEPDRDGTIVAREQDGSDGAQSSTLDLAQSAVQTLARSAIIVNRAAHRIWPVQPDPVEIVNAISALGVDQEK